jgi:preprotein translocase subunit Sec63
MYRNSIQWYIDQWLRKAGDKFGRQKDHAQNRHTHGKQERKKNEEQRQQQSKSYTEKQRNKDERYFAAILGLSPGTTSGDLKNRYRELVMQYHPDRVAHLGPKLREFAEQQMKEINEAYDFFKDKYGIS